MRARKLFKAAARGLDPGTITRTKRRTFRGDPVHQEAKAAEAGPKAKRKPDSKCRSCWRRVPTVCSASRGGKVPCGLGVTCGCCRCLLPARGGSRGGSRRPGSSPRPTPQAASTR